MNYIKKNKHFLALIVLAVIFFFIYSYLPLSQIQAKQVPLSEVSMRFNTPDEVVNNYFTNLYAKTGKMYYEEPFNLILQGVVFPRWAKPVDSMITPGTFQGIILIYGSLAKVFTTHVIPFFTPFFAVLAVLFFYLFSQHFFEKKLAFVSALLIFIFPGFWYYASRTMFHNVLFICLLLGGLYFLISLLKSLPLDTEKHRILQGKTQNILMAAVTGLFLGLALITRTSEIVWVAIIVLLIIIFYCKKFNKQKLSSVFLYFCIFCIFVFLCFLPVLYHNKILYGSYFSSGYSQIISENLEDASVIKKISLVQAIFLPFGFHPKVILTHVIYKYFFKLFWLWILFFLAGLFFWLKQNKTKEQKLYFYIFIFLSFYLLIYYGSWFFQDSLNPNLISIGSSYIRYFLPIYIFAMPFVALFFYKIFKLIKSKKAKYPITTVVSCLLLIVCYHQVYLTGPESLKSVNHNLLTYRLQAKDVINLTQNEDIILTDVSHDKIIFPERQHVIVPQGSEELKNIKFVLKLTNVYFFYRSKDANEDYLNEIKFKPYGLEIYDGQEIEGGGILFKVRKIEEHLAQN